MAISPSESESSSCSSRPAGNLTPQPNVMHLIDKLDSLASFYQKQLEWVDTTQVEVNIVEIESDDDQLSESETQSRRPTTRPLTSAVLRRMHWRRQMRSLESKLNGNVHKRRYKSASQRASSSTRKADEEFGSHYILGMFGQIIGARMESCRRVQQLVAVNKTFDDKRKRYSQRLLVPKMDRTDSSHVEA
ncbi:hypothetical protein B0H19DRAFT_1179243 [Mycena capillaripes]|nr:hypothetical protein B0H19DRAFT_1179243 [Mycena capillaripes]